jgi:hypothetical protein
MGRLPTVGGDDNNWGQVLNDFLLETHKPTGGLADGTISDATIAGTLSQSKITNLTSDLAGLSDNASTAASDIASLTSDVWALESDMVTKVAHGELVYNVRDYGAVGNGVNDDQPAIQAAIMTAFDAGGGTVYLPPGVYRLHGSIGKTDAYLKNVRLTGAGYRGVGYTWGTTPDHIGAAVLVCNGNFPAITGMWVSCEISNVGLDAEGHGGQAIKAHFSKSLLRGIEAVRWSGVGFWMNDGTFTDDLGYLNRIENCNISDTGGVENGVALQLEYRFIDSWVVNNNIESPGTDIQINSGGPFRIIGNHLNGNRSPQNNIVFNGGVRECLIANNILEGSRAEAIKYSAPGWETSPERASIVVTGNIIRQTAQSGGPVMTFNGVGGVGFRALGLSVVGNTISTDYSPTYVISATTFDDISATGNYWRFGHNSGSAPVHVHDCTNVEVIGNHGDNNVETV